ncbi:MAG: hypothetical protein A2289_20275 [Deltaproteobacteria bacterium RIFOXYA12_FULL_58_15]|nr:MAG: hypothetical protein A2289_20275 [Deltaproteobacteria bacterium RIFOXYA12_FULL_58_15]OGR07183.1 MAG: hypothetical protein A2341_03575 [Deltaproteobacteria bacterium RIFOXYB12_FULL_58_9]
MSQSDRKAVIVAVDDEPFILEAWKEALGDRFEVRTFTDSLAANRFFESHDVDVALLDVCMPNMDGLTLLEHLKAAQPNAEAILVTGHGTIQMAVQALQHGAFDFMCKPVEDLNAAVRRIENALERKRLRDLNANLSSQLEAYGPNTDLVGNSRLLEKIRSLIHQIADSNAPVLIRGESGTGKELAARLLHSSSNRASKPFIAVNCAAVTDTLIDSELFGHEKGAFTGAMSAHTGLFEAADGGVLFLDELGEVPQQTQVRLLRAIQEGEVRPVGSSRNRHVDVRVIAATNADLEKAMRTGGFREDLYYRISTFHVDMPPLRQRTEDIPAIAQYLLAKATRRYNRKTPSFADDALAALVSYDWPGNVRELNNAIEHALALCNTGPIELSHFPTFVTTRARSRARNSASEPGTTLAVPYAEGRAQVLDTFEKRYLTDLLTHTTGNLSESSRRSGIDRANLRRLLKRHNIKAEDFKDSAL